MTQPLGEKVRHPVYRQFSITPDGVIIGSRGRVLRGALDRDGYIKISIWIDGKSKHQFAHTLVAETFLGPRPTPKHEVAHWDGRPDNNAVDNLRWATATENQADRGRHGTKIFGAKHRLAKMSDEKVAAVRARHADGVTGAQLAREHGVHESLIYQIVNRKIWTHV